MTSLPRIGFIGAGRLTGALAPALTRAEYPLAGVWSRSQPSPTAADGRVRIPAILGSAQAVVDAADLVFLAVPDAAIAIVAAALHWRAGAAAVHCSGAFGLELLGAAAQQGAAVGAFHPLQTLPGGETNFGGITIAIEASASELARMLAGMAEALGARPLGLPDGARAVYHASAVLASNYLIGLLAEAASLWETFGLSREQGLQSLLPLAKQTVANLERLSPEEALTGPIARGDVETVARHVQALPTAGLKALYRQLALHTIPLARRKGTLRGQAAQRLATTLQGD